MMAETNGYKHVGYIRSRMFDAEQPMTRGGALVFGLLMGSAITVIMLTLALAMGAAYGQWNEGMAYCLSFIIAGVAGGVLQQAWFNPDVSLKMKYPARMVGFALTYFVVLFGCAWIGEWIPRETDISAWLGFIGTFIAIFAIISIAFSVRYRKEGGTYTELLAKYREQRGGKSSK